MLVRQVMLAATAAMTLGTLPGAAPAFAQGYGYGDGYGRGDYGPPRRYERRYDPDDDYDRRPPPPRYGYGRRGSICVTARGNCRYPPQPYNTPCECEIPGFGPKRGAIGG